ncbi:protein phosphatase 1 regulatory subunit 32 isoform X2 [Notolabrus celidotus]|uniref:protein phosphatase 1 regulatory subunit 32 isoform X2 n=1 Tax=Notolabrus celidotus TaxID=1203425 RepID=UPI00148FD652|nr:protein phosphatase 1 regulatory subunit 32 isoform X2 [Notolabrus celidotus]
MDEQGRIVMPIIGATGNRAQLAGDKLHSTSYREFYGQKGSGMVNFSSHLGNPGRSGFTSNNRPAVYYKPSLDLIDNPQMLLMLSDNFISQTKQHYQPHVLPDGSGSLPSLLEEHRQSGFHQQMSHPKTAILEKKTEYQRVYDPKHFTPTVHQNHVTLGPKTESGFTRETDRQPRKISVVDPQQTYSSVMRSDFTCPSFLQGKEATPSLCGRSCQESGFTRGAVAPLASDSTSILPSSKTKQETPSKKTIGKKEPTGSLSNAPNNQAFPLTPFDSSHFTTHYRNTFCHRADDEKLTSGGTCYGIISPKKDYAYNRRDMDRFIFRG